MINLDFEVGLALVVVWKENKVRSCGLLIKASNVVFAESWVCPDADCF
jgi:hypothetical protein